MGTPGPADATVYHRVHSLVLNKVPRWALGWAAPTVFALERLYVRGFRRILGLRPSEKYFAYSWVLKRVLAGPRRILDVGPGDSLFPCELVRRGHDVVAIDLVSDSTPWRFPGLGFVRADLRYAPFRNGVFEVVTGLSSIEHIDEGQELACRELSRITKDGGRLLVTLPFDENADKMKDLLSRAFTYVAVEYYLAARAQTSWRQVAHDQWHRHAPGDVVVAHLSLAKRRV